MRDRSGGVDAEAEAGGEDERAPVSSGAARWLAAEARGGRISAAGGGVAFLKGAYPWRNRGTSRGGSLPTSERHPAGNGPKPVGTRDVRCACTADRIEGEG
jgi:hypothetical protein